jgi:hypothetical protein
MIIVRLLSPGPWLVGTTKAYSGIGADIVMESITLIYPTRVRYSYTEAHHGSPPHARWEQRESFLSPTPTLKQILDALKKQVLVGRTYLDTARGLLNADPVLLQTAPTFFGMAIDGSLELAQMAVARLYDTTRNTMSVPKMLKRAEHEAGTFQRGSGQEVRNRQ